MTAKEPITSVDKNKIQILEDSVSRRNFQLQQDTANKNLYHIRFNWKPNKNYELVIEEKAILTPFQTFNKELKKTFTFDETDNYGDIIFDINGLEKNVNYIVELIDESKKKTFDSRILRNENKISYIKFPGGKYTLRIIKDLNENNRWDGADYKTKTQAEPIWYFDKTFTIRANWEQNEKIDVDFNK
ncbi:hypothetical protein G5B35_19520 [Parapusillimonas sp. SGNA-6]|nr:hypothetical protein [Parapusillimonas sp. SGNA-6]